MNKIEENFLRDVKEISYILEDEGYRLTYNALMEKEDKNKILFMIRGGNKKFINNYKGWEDNLLKGECYVEYINRLQDICEKYGYKTILIQRSNGTFAADCIVIFKSDNINKSWRRVRMGSELKIRYTDPEVLFMSNVSESVSIDSIIPQIEELSYILEDEGMECHIRETPISLAYNKKDSYSIRISPPDIQKYIILSRDINQKRAIKWKEEERVWNKRNKGASWEDQQRDPSYPKYPEEVNWEDVFTRDLLKSRSFMEYRDRVYEICKKNNFDCYRSTNGIAIKKK